MFKQEGIKPAAVQRHQSLHEMVSIKDRMMIGPCKLVESLHPELRRKMTLGPIAQGDRLDLRVSVLRENRCENRLQFIDTAAKQLEDFFRARRNTVRR